jgi:hypothetical protein
VTDLLDRRAAGMINQPQSNTISTKTAIRMVVMIGSR